MQQAIKPVVAIFGLGLIGGSLARALQHAKWSAEIHGYVRTAETAARAKELALVDQGFHQVGEQLAEADIVVLAVPVSATAALLEQIAPWIGATTIVTDCGSSKCTVIAAAKQVLSAQQFSRFVPGHPIAGSEKNGLYAGVADLFNQRRVILTPENETNALAIARVTELWQACGAEVGCMAAQKHDQILATVSHLPHVLAYALVAELASRENHAVFFEFAASGFRDFTRIASSDPTMWTDIVLSNKAHLIAELSHYQARLAQIKQYLVDEDRSAVHGLFSLSQQRRRDWLLALERSGGE